ncbi:ribosome-assembly protein 3-domain-containing protein [Hypoxylon cercidicola]|nr:ribosome-assembly protein 3-domain-containing protein [Hypoxylon cercidicola]
MPGKDATSQGFTSYYLQQSTKEFAEDLDKIRNAGDFKGDAVAMLVKSLQQGTSLFSAADQERIVKAQDLRGSAGFILRGMHIILAK